MRLLSVPVVCASGSAWTGTGPLTHDKHSRDIAFLNNYAQERWEVRQWWHVCTCMCTEVNSFKLLQRDGMVTIS